jgi:hypothetical protein
MTRVTAVTIRRALVAILTIGLVAACAPLAPLPQTTSDDGVFLSASAEEPAGQGAADDNADPAHRAASDDDQTESGASPVATGFYWVVAAGALTYLVLSRRKDRDSCKAQLSALRTAERKRMVREDLLKRAEQKLADAEAKFSVLKDTEGPDSTALALAYADVDQAREAIDLRKRDVDAARKVERSATEALEACEQAKEERDRGKNPPSE